jgi:hypothetical protein
VRSQPSNGKRELDPSSLVRRLSWYKMTLMDAQEQEDSRSTLRESIASTKFRHSVALICSVIDSVTSIIQGEIDKHSWRDSSVQDDVCEFVP